MFTNKKLFIAFNILILFSALFLTAHISLAADNDSQSTSAVYYDQDFDLCYTGCAGWKFYWAHDPIWDYVESQCTLNGADMAKTLVKYAFNTVRGSADFGPFIQSIFCAGAVKMNLKPKLDICRRDCKINIWTYAPDLYVDRGPQGIIYSKNKHQLQITMLNGGYVYTPAFKVDIYAASTDERDCHINDDEWEKINSYTVKELAPTYASRHIQGIPHKDIHTIDWEAEDDKCNVVKIMVDPDNRIPELDEANGNGYGTNNTDFYTINNLPSLPRYQITDIKHHFLDDNLDDLVLNFKVANSGELLGKPKIEVRDCYGDKTLRAVKNLILSPGDSQPVELKVKDLFWPKDPISFHYVDLCITATDENGLSLARTAATIFSGSISGRVLDMVGQPVANATVTLDSGEQTTTDDKGNYYFSGLTRQGKYIITATSSEYDQRAKQEVTLSLDPNPYTVIQPQLHLTDIDLILFDQPASLTINCPFGDYLFRLNGQYFSYQGDGQIAQQKLAAIMPGDYQLILSKPGYNTQVLNINFGKGQERKINCNLRPLEAYIDDQAINFEPVLNNLWDFTPPDEFHPLGVSISGDGSTIFMALGNAHTQQVKLFIFDQTGQKLAEVGLPKMAAYNAVYLSPTYDGSSVLVNSYLVFNRQGKIISRRPDDKGYQAPGSLSWDGNLICDFSGLYDSHFNPLYTGVWGRELDQPHTRCRFGQFASFTANNQIVSQCEKVDAGLCRLSFWDGSQYPLLNLDATNYWHTDITPDSRHLLATISQAGQDKAVYITNRKVVWQQPIEEANGRVSISPAGNYAVVLSPHGQDYTLYLFDSHGRNLLAAAKSIDNSVWEHDFYDVKATGQGIFYLRYDGQIHFGVLGKTGHAQKQSLNQLAAQTNSQLGQPNSSDNFPTENKNLNQAEASHQTKTLLGRLWGKVKQFFLKIFHWIF